MPSPVAVGAVGVGRLPLVVLVADLFQASLPVEVVAVVGIQVVARLADKRYAVERIGGKGLAIGEPDERGGDF